MACGLCFCAAKGAPSAPAATRSRFELDGCFDKFQAGEDSIDTIFDTPKFADDEELELPTGKEEDAEGRTETPEELELLPPFPF